MAESNKDLKKTQPPPKNGTKPPRHDDATAQALAEAMSSSFKIVKFLMVLLIASFIISCAFTVKPNQVAVVLRFGKPVGIGADQILKPGLHFALPAPIDEIVRIPISETKTLVTKSTWLPLTPEQEALGQQPETYPFLRPGIDGYTITADANIVHVRAILKYRLLQSDPLSYTFGFADPTNLIQSALENAIIFAAAHFSADDIIFRNKTAFDEQVRQRFSEIIDQMQIGITIDSMEVLARAPLAVQPAFDALLQAQQTSRKTVNEAEAYARATTNTAIGTASAIINNGITRSNQIVKTVFALAKSFSEQLPYYQTNALLFKQRLLNETIAQILTNSQDKFFIPSRDDGKPRELRLQLSREPLTPTEK
jgi:membrane protease subunit HflK